MEKLLYTSAKTPSPLQWLLLLLLLLLFNTTLMLLGAGGPLSAVPFLRHPL